MIHKWSPKAEALALLHSDLACSATLQLHFKLYCTPRQQPTSSRYLVSITSSTPMTLNSMLQSTRSAVTVIGDCFHTVHQWFLTNGLSRSSRQVRDDHKKDCKPAMRGQNYHSNPRHCASASSWPCQKSGQYSRQHRLSNSISTTIASSVIGNWLDYGKAVLYSVEI